MAGAAPNAAQAASWNGPNGQVWIDMRETLDRELAPLGAAGFQALAPRPAERILDIGCGCGTTTLDLARAVGPSGLALGLDISRPMIEVARTRAAEAGLAQARFEAADVQAHVFEAGGFDAAYSRFGVMLFSDPAAAFANIARALRPGGRLAFVCWRGPQENPSMSLPLAAAETLLPPMPAADPLAPGPFAFADRARVLGLLAEAGFAEARAEPFDTLISPGGLEESLALYTRIGPVGRALRESPELTGPVTAAVRAALAAHQTPDGLKLSAAVWVVQARKP